MVSKKRAAALLTFLVSAAVYGFVSGHVDGVAAALIGLATGVVIPHIDF